MRSTNASSNTIQKLKQLWNVWNLRGFILFSFSLQCILIVGSSLRIQTSRTWVHRFIWLVYLLADWAAYYAIGLVVPVDRLKSDNEYTSDIHAFWAPFFLLHIGGPNTIAGFSLEDNELWDRSVLHILVQAGATGIAIYRALSKPELLAPTLLVFIAALTRYVGRVLALSKGSLDDLRDSISNKLVTEDPAGSMTRQQRTSNKQRAEGDDSTAIPMAPQAGKHVEPVELVASSYKSFQEYKGIFCGLSIRDENVMENRKRLYELKPEEAFTEMEIQASLAYDLFYTKIWTIIENKLGKLLHFISLSSEVGALVLWAFANKHGYHKVDIQLTNTLLIGGIVVDVASTLKLTLSDLVIYHLSKYFPKSHSTLNKVLKAKKSSSDRDQVFVLFRRWSGSIKQFDLMHQEFGSHYKVKWLHPITGYEKGVSRVKLTKGVKEQIINGIKYRASTNGKLKMQRSRLLGDYSMEMYDPAKLTKAMLEICKRLGVVDALFVCHIATQYFYKDHTDQKSQGNIFCDVSIQISEYLMYLLYYQTKMIQYEGAELDMTVEDMKGQLDNMVVAMSEHLETIKSRMSNDEHWKYIPSCQDDEVNYNSHVLRAIQKQQEDYLHYVLQKVEGIEKITVEVISKLAMHIVRILESSSSEQLLMEIWIDFLLYAAIHCSARIHVQQIGNGGQLLTIVWLMMTHLGLKIKFRN